MKVSELLALPDDATRRPVELSGYLIASTHLTYIVEDKATAYSKQPHWGVVLNRGAIAGLFEGDVPFQGGSSVELVGEISLKGTVTHTGMGLLPMYIPYVYKYRFSHSDYACWSFTIGDPFKDLYVLAPQTIKASSLAAIKSLFPASLTILQLKAQLEAREVHLVRTHVRGAELAEAIKNIESAGFQWKTVECEIWRGIP